MIYKVLDFDGNVMQSFVGVNDEIPEEIAIALERGHTVEKWKTYNVLPNEKVGEVTEEDLEA